MLYDDIGGRDKVADVFSLPDPVFTAARACPRSIHEVVADVVAGGFIGVRHRRLQVRS